MTLFLASVRDEREAAAARAGGADIIDFKDPSNGALGAVAPETIERGVAKLAGRALTSATAPVTLPAWCSVTSLVTKSPASRP